MPCFLMVACTVILFAIPQAFAQQNLEDVVHLKDGSVIRGIIVEQILNQSVKIQTRDGNLLVYSLEEISQITKELTIGQKEIRGVSAGKNPHHHITLQGNL